MIVAKFVKFSPASTAVHRLASSSVVPDDKPSLGQSPQKMNLSSVVWQIFHIRKRVHTRIVK